MSGEKSKGESNYVLTKIQMFQVATLSQMIAQ